MSEIGALYRNGGSQTEQIPGIDQESVTRWLRDRTPLVPPLRFELLEGGRSNLTCRITDRARRSVVLRRPPLHSVLSSAHDVLRECRIIRALHDSDVPVPRVVDHEDDTAVTGAPFYVMWFVEGTVLRDVDDAEEGLTPSVRPAACDNVLDVLARLHTLDPAAAGLASLARGEQYLERQLDRWHTQLERGRTRDLPMLEQAYRRLVAELPPDVPKPRVVHGDYRFDNLILNPLTGEVAAVLDWELTTLGDPLADLGLLLVYWAESDDDLLPLGELPTRAEGFHDREQVVDRYADAVGEIRDLRYYVAFSAWRLACILEGVRNRHESGAYGGADASVVRFRGVVPRLGERALAVLDGQDWSRW